MRRASFSFPSQLLHFKSFNKKTSLIPSPFFSLPILLNRSQIPSFIISSCKVALSLHAWVNWGVPGLWIFFFPLGVSHDVLDGIQKSSNLPWHAASFELAGLWFLIREDDSYGRVKMLYCVPVWACICIFLTSFFIIVMYTTAFPLAV